MKPFAKEFYNSQAWKKTAANYAKSQSHLCELCRDQGKLTPGEIVHHKIMLTPERISDPTIALSWDNLQLVCREHHAMLHGRNQKRFIIDESGHVTALDSPP